MEDEGKQEEKFDFTSEGEALGYISLDQARVLAMRTARESPGAYGRSFRNVPMAFEVVEAEETEDHYVITVSFRPEGEFVGRAGREQFFIEKEGAVALRQVLSLPGRTGWRRFSFGLLAVSLVVIVAAAVGGVFAASGGSGGNDDSAPQAAVPPTSTPAPAPTTAPVAATATPKAGPTPGSASGPLPSVPVPALKEGTLAFKEDFESGAAGGIQLGQGADVDCVASNCFLRQLVSGDPGGVTSWFGETFWQDFVLSVKFNIRSGRGGRCIRLAGK